MARLDVFVCDGCGVVRSERLHEFFICLLMQDKEKLKR